MNRPLIILGGGLWGGLLAYFLTKLRPDVEFILYEKNSSLGGNHTWSFHEKDISDKAFELLRPMIEKNWNRYEVRFPKYSKIIHHSYHSISSRKFHGTLLQEIPSNRIKTGVAPDPEGMLENASFVIDAR